jgi:hypothetical protein
MQNFYTHKDNQQKGPFSIDELKNQKITGETMVWFEGADTWKKAMDIDLLKDIVENVAPSFQANPNLVPPPLPMDDKKDTANQSFEFNTKKKNKNLIPILLASFFLIGLGVFYYFNQQAKQEEIQTQLEEQKLKIQEQEKIVYVVKTK